MLERCAASGFHVVGLMCSQFLVRVLDDYAASMLKFMPEKKEVDLSAVIVAPMPGMLKSVSVAMGDQVHIN